MNCAFCGLQLSQLPLRCPRCGAATNAEPEASPTSPELGLGLLDDRTTVRSALNVAQVPDSEGFGPPIGVDGQGFPMGFVGQPVPSQADYSNPGAHFEVGQRFAQADGLQHGPRAAAGVRLGAFALDAVILGVAYFLFMLLIGVIGMVLAGVSEAVMGVVTLIGYGLAVVGSGAYLVVLNGRGQTLGKKILNIAVVDQNTGAAIGNSRAFVRYLMYIVMGLPCYLGFLSIPLSPQLRGWHDQAADDVVVELPTRA